MGKNHASQYANFGSLPLYLLFIVISKLLLFICTEIGFLVFVMGFHDSNIIMIYLLGVLSIALIT